MIGLWLLSLILAVLSGTPLSPAAPLPTVAPGADQPYVVVFVWHDVVGDRKEVWFDTTRDTFRAQLDAIARAGANVVTLAALRDHLEHGAPLPVRPVLLTFDDNGTGIYRNAFPLLVAHRFPATLFVHTNFVGRTTSKAHSSWDDLRAMESSGLISVQSLTANHPPDLRALSDAAVTHELQLSRHAIEAKLGHSVYALVYPEDNYDERLARLAAANGYELGFTEDWGNAGASQSLLLIHRYSILTRFDQGLKDLTAR